jgi:cobaltochelatase CobT
VRERLTGEAPPAAAEPLVQVFRKEIEARAGADLDKLADAQHDQKAFARISKTILKDLQLTDEMDDGEEAEPDEQGQEDASRNRLRTRKATAKARRPSNRPWTRARRARPRPSADTDLTATDEDGEPEESDEAPDVGEGDQPAGLIPRARPRSLRTASSPRPMTRWSPPRSSATAEELGRLRAYPRPAARHLSNVGLAPGQPPAAQAAWPSRTAPGASTSRRASSTSPA